MLQKETDAPKGKKTKPKRGAKATTRRRGTGNPATDPGPPVNGALKRIDQWPGLEDDSVVRPSQSVLQNERVLNSDLFAAYEMSATLMSVCWLCVQACLHDTLHIKVD